MQTFKIEYYEQEHGQGTFPPWRRLDLRETEEVWKKLVKALGVKDTSSGLEIVWLVQELSSVVEGADARADDFDLGRVLDQLGISAAEKVYINWYRFDNLDEMYIADVITTFSDIWYPSSDDIDVFDSSMEWIVSIDHDGMVRVTRTNNG